MLDIFYHCLSVVKKGVNRNLTILIDMRHDCQRTLKMQGEILGFLCTQLLRTFKSYDHDPIYFFNGFFA